MNKIYLQIDLAECYLLQFVYHICLIDLNFSLIKLCLFSCRMFEKTIFIFVDRETIICGLTA
jgi:hypothetical protein